MKNKKYIRIPDRVGCAAHSWGNALFYGLFGRGKYNRLSAKTINKLMDIAQILSLEIAVSPRWIKKTVNDIEYNFSDSRYFIPIKVRNWLFRNLYNNL